MFTFFFFLFLKKLNTWGNKNDKRHIDQEGSISNAILLLRMIGPRGVVTYHLTLFSCGTTHVCSRLILTGGGMGAHLRASGTPFAADNLSGMDHYVVGVFFSHFALFHHMHLVCFYFPIFLCLVSLFHFVVCHFCLNFWCRPPFNLVH